MLRFSGVPDACQKTRGPCAASPAGPQTMASLAPRPNQGTAQATHCLYSRSSSASFGSPAKSTTR